MKWLFLLLVTINVILFVVQVKDKESKGQVSSFNKVPGAQHIKLLKEEVKSSNERCVVVGAIADKSALDQVVGYLTGKNIEFELIEKELMLAPSYWVYVKDGPDESLLKKLDNLKIDSYMVASGELSGRLSVGLFANIDLAQDMIEMLSKVGVNAAFIEKMKIKKTKWVSFGLNENGTEVPVVKALKDMQINLGEIKEFFCKSIASEK